MHFAIGFFGYPFEGQYEQSITIEHDGVSLQYLYIIPADPCHCQFNNTLAPEKTYVTYSRSAYRCLTFTLPSCPNGYHTDKSERATWYVRRWVERCVQTPSTAVCDTINARTDTSRLPRNDSTPN